MYDIVGIRKGEMNVIDRTIRHEGFLGLILEGIIDGKNDIEEDQDYNTQVR